MTTHATSADHEDVHLLDHVRRGSRAAVAFTCGALEVPAIRVARSRTVNDVERMRRRVDELFECGMYEEAERVARQRETKIKELRQKCKLIASVVC